MALSRQTLYDLYEVGRNIEITNPNDPDNPIVVYMRKLTPKQQEIAVRKASAAKVGQARIMDRPDGDEDKLILSDQVYEMGGRDEWISHLVDIELGSLRAKAEQELSEEEEWSDDNYLQNLFDAWDEEMQKDYAENGEEKCQPETLDTWNGIKDFNRALEEKLEQNRERLTKEYSEKPDVVLFREVADSLVERDSGLTWLRVFRNYQMLFGALDPETKEPLFTEVDQIDDLPIEVYKELLKGISELSLSPLEVK